MDFSLENIFRRLPIEGPTINNVLLPIEFAIICYLVIIISTILSTIFFTRKKHKFIEALKKSILVAFFSSGILYAVHADSGWLKWLKDDYKQFSSITTEEKLLRLDGPLYDFSRYLKVLISGNYTIISPLSREDYPIARTEYFLLPIKNKPDAQFIIVLGETEAVFDDETGTLIKGGTVIKDTALVFKYADDAYLLTKKGGF